MKNADEWTLKERIKAHLFTEGVEKNRIVTLIIDEGQKITEPCLEYLREFLNYETNEYKLLQIVIFAQSEFAETIKKYPNLADRINLYHQLRPLDFQNMVKMIRFRLRRSTESRRAESVFTLPGLWSVYRHTRGYPRKIINLCHRCLLAMIIQNKTRVGARIVAACARHQQPDTVTAIRNRWALAFTALFVLGIVSIPAIQWFGRTSDPNPKVSARESTGESTGESIGSSIDASAREIKTAHAALKQPPVEKPVVALPMKTESTPVSSQESETKKAISATESIPVQTAQTPSNETESTVSQPATRMAQPVPAPALRSDTGSDIGSGTGDVDPPLVARISETDTPVLEPAAVHMPIQDHKTPIASMVTSPVTPTDEDLLGQAPVAYGENLSRVMQRVYGFFSPMNIAKMLEANPWISDPDILMDGDVVRFPAVATRVNFKDRPHYWIQIRETDSLAAAFRELRGLSGPGTRHPHDPL